MFWDDPLKYAVTKFVEGLRGKSGKVSWTRAVCSIAIIAFFAWVVVIAKVGGDRMLKEEEAKVKENDRQHVEWRRQQGR